MADVEKTEFEFPDEGSENPRKGGKVVDTESEIEIEANEAEIEIIDDTPEKDRGRENLEEPVRDITEDELSKYDEGVKKRMKRFADGYHTERRAKEAVEREKEEA